VCHPRLPRSDAPVNSTPGYRGPMTRALRIGACRALCSWHPTGDRLGHEAVFACTGCGSEWVPSEPWTPIDHTGSVPVQVAEARRSRGGG
jgi:hypothetical protein